MKKPRNWEQIYPNPNCSEYEKNSQWSITSVATYMTIIKILTEENQKALNA